MKFRTEIKVNRVAYASDKWQFTGFEFATVDQAITHAVTVSTLWTDVYAWRVIDNLSDPPYVFATEGV